MSDKVFVDANILIYAHDADAASKHERAKSVLHRLWTDRTGVVSPHVLQEFYVTVTRKIASPLPTSAARLIVSTYAIWCTDVTPADIATAFRIEDEARLGFSDALIIAAALKSGASRLLTDNLNAGQTIAGIRIENPLNVPLLSS